MPKMITVTNTWQQVKGPVKLKTQQESDTIYFATTSDATKDTLTDLATGNFDKYLSTYRQDFEGLTAGENVILQFRSKEKGASFEVCQFDGTPV